MVGLGVLGNKAHVWKMNFPREEPRIFARVFLRVDDDLSPGPVIVPVRKHGVEYLDLLPRWPKP